MFLSRLTLNPRDPQARFDLARPYEMHRTLWRGFPGGEPRRILFRVDADRRGGPPVVLVQSDRQPDWAALPAGYTARVPEAKAFDPVLRAGQRLRFRLRANPTKRVAAGNPRLGAVAAGKRVALCSEGDQLRWLLRKAGKGGFRVPGDWVSKSDPERRAADWGPDFADGNWYPNFRVDVAPEGRARNDKPGHRDGAFLAVRFEGVLEVTDPDRFVTTIREGVGSAKGYGFGLLSVAPAA